MLDDGHVKVKRVASPFPAGPFPAKGMAQVEIARQMGSSLNALYKLSHDARHRLKRGLEQAGFTAQEFATAFD